MLFLAKNCVVNLLLVNEKLIQHSFIPFSFVVTDAKTEFDKIVQINCCGFSVLINAPDKTLAKN